MKYDYRNLLTEFRLWRVTPGDNNVGKGGDPSSYDTYLIYYYYDEAGNRICKKIYKWSEITIDTITTGTDSPIIDSTSGSGTSGTGGDGSNTWVLQQCVIYLHDVSGKEIAIYNSNAIDQYNLFGSDNVGKIDNQGAKFFYLKDHLGTVRAVLDTNNIVISGNDLDAWGYPLQGRTYDADVNVNQKYKFTSKERDLESALDFTTGYDYFGARYYNSRIGRWGGIEPLQDKFPGITPYNYSLCNSIIIHDINGLIPKITKQESKDFLSTVYSEKNFGYINPTFQPLAIDLLKNEDLVITDINDSQKDNGLNDYAAFTGYISITQDGEKSFNGLGIVLKNGIYPNETGNNIVSTLLFDHELYHLYWYQSLMQSNPGINASGLNDYFATKEGQLHLARHELTAIDYTMKAFKTAYNKGVIDKDTYQGVKKSFKSYKEEINSKIKQLE